jgi:hypothetical protein
MTTKLEKRLSSDEVEAKAIKQRNHHPSFVKASSLLGSECIDGAKLSEHSLGTRSRSKVMDLFGVNFHHADPHEVRRGNS